MHRVSLLKLVELAMHLAAQVLELSHSTFTSLLGNLSNLMEQWRIQTLRRVPLLANLSTKDKQVRGQLEATNLALRQLRCFYGTGDYQTA